MFLAIPPGWNTAIGWVAPYHIALFLAMLVGAALFSWQMRRLGVSWSRVLSTLPLAVVMPVAFARIVDMAVYSPDDLLSNPFDLLRVLGGGLSSHGAILGLALLAFALGRFYAVPAARIADGLVFWGLLGVVAARVGDFLHAQGVGTPSDLPWAVAFHRMPDHGTVLRHPANLYEIVFVAVLMILAFLFFRRLRGRRPGLVATAVSWLYLLGRLFIDGIREVPLLAEDPRIATGQLLSAVAIVLLAPVVWILLRRRDSGNEAVVRKAVSGRGVRANTDEPPEISVRVRSAVVALFAAGVLGGMAEVLVNHVRFTSGRMVSPISVIVSTTIMWALPVLVLGWIGGRMGYLLSGWSMRVPRMGVSIVLFVVAMVATVSGMLLLPMALAALIMVFFALTMPAFHTIRDLVVYLTGGIGAMALHAALFLLYPGSNRHLGAALFIMFGLAAVLTDRVRLRARSTPR